MSDLTTFEFAARAQNTQGATRRETPLHHVSHQNAEAAAVVFNEVPFCAQLTLRGSPENPDFLAGVEKVLGFALPVQPLTSHASDSYYVFWISPGEWLILAENIEPAVIEASLRAELTGHFAVVDVSAGQTLMTLSGEAVQQVLQKSCGYDVEASLPVGKVVTTTFAKATLVLHHQAEGKYFLIVRRSFADYVWRWLVDASAEYGLTVV
ncbi:sarcosine oxidase subunit gamma [Marinomonas pollencensis]|uniref:Sarcosine oxidase subunit gamma n=1 Tax=Marinomonas pollencensis TaxID=491954 RepID=A0A3E0DT93_9GAMM|nr:sarcosine oxidase subunit gamma family protein [Marinomonas pollencensis]REG86777.1 sarcosine oxidase subunit gamma [Marinomonas pollencensis]